MSRRRDLLIAAALALLTFALYAQVRHFEFVSYDDNAYITANPHVQQGLTAQGVHWAITSVDTANWHPLTRLTHLLDVHLFGLRAGPHHLINVAIHIANALLLYALLRMLVPSVTWPSALAAGLLALHPLRVESVAWVSERKDVLSALFFLLTLIAYVKYARSARRGARRGWFVASLLLLALGLMSKAMLVTVPGVLMLLDYWPLGRLRDRNEFRRRLIEKLPFFALCVALAVVTFLAQHAGGAVRSSETIPVAMRLQNAAVSYVLYLLKTVAPARLAVLYPYPSSISVATTVGAVVLLVAITWLAWRGRSRRPYVIVGWLWYLGTLVPVIGLVQVGQQAYADRYTYIPHIGLFIAVAWLAAEGWRRLGTARLPRIMYAALVVMLLALLMVTTYRQIGVWRNSETLWAHTAAVTRDNWIAWNHLATIYASQGRLDEALRLTAAVVERQPTFAIGQLNRGNTLMRAGEHTAAIDAFRRAIDLQPNLAAAHNNLGILLASAGRTAEALAHFRAAVEAEPNVPEWRNNLAAIERRIAEQQAAPPQ